MTEIVQQHGHDGLVLATLMAGLVPMVSGLARLTDVLDTIGTPPRVFIPRMRELPTIDASGVAAPGDFVRRCKIHGTIAIAADVQPSLRTVLPAKMRNG